MEPRILKSCFRLVIPERGVCMEENAIKGRTSFLATGPVRSRRARRGTLKEPVLLVLIWFPLGLLRGRGT